MASKKIRKERRKNFNMDAIRINNEEAYEFLTFGCDIPKDKKSKKRIFRKEFSYLSR